MTVFFAELALVFGTALLVYGKRRRETFFDPHHEQAFQVLLQSFPAAAEGGQQEETVHA